MRLRLTAVLTLLAFCLPPAVEAGFTAFPHSEFFTVNIGGFDEAEPDDDIGNVYRSGSQMVVVTNTATLAYTGITEDQLWILIDAKPVFLDDTGSPPAVSPADAFAFYFSRDTNRLRVHSGGWGDASAATYTEGTMVRIAIHADYRSGVKNWDIYTGSSGATTLTRQNATPLSMNGGFTGGDDFGGVLVKAGRHAYVNTVALSAPAPEAVGAFTSDANLALLQTTPDSEVTLSIPGHDYDVSANQMDQQLGFDLRAGLAAGDDVYVPNVNNGGMFLNFTAASPFTTGGNFADAPVNRTTQIVISRTAGNDYFAFFPYDALTVLDGGDGDGDGNPRIFGTDTSNGGFNALTCPSTTTLGALAFNNSVGAPISPSDGDRIITLDPFGQYFYGDGAWRSGRVNASGTALTAGTSFWYFKSTLDVPPVGVFYWDVVP